MRSRPWRIPRTCSIGTCRLRRPTDLRTGKIREKGSDTVVLGDELVTVFGIPSHDT